MRCVIQRVEYAKVFIRNSEKSGIGRGLLVYLAVKDEDNAETAGKTALKILRMRLFPDEAGVMNISLLDMGYSCLVVSQFTLLADCSRGNRPFYGNAANPAHAENIYNEFIAEMKKHCACESGVFGADMRIESVNWGPVTIIYE